MCSTNFSWVKFVLLFLMMMVYGQQISAQTNRALRWSFPNNTGLDFSSGSAVSVVDALTGEEGCASICDEDGNYVFYSNGQTVWQANGTVMQGGTGLVGDPMSTQSAVIVPSVTSSTRYYLFVSDAQSGPDGVQYYNVEMTLNGGNGAVVPTPMQLLTPATEKLCATKHGNDRDYWVVCHAWNSDEFHAFSVSQGGVNPTPTISAVGIEHLNSAGSGEEMGYMRISPDGEWIATCNFSSGYVQLFRFDNETGVVSDPITLASGGSTFPFGCEFSADSKKFYYARRVSNAINPVGIHQFDLDHASIDCLLASEKVFTNGDPFRLYTHLQLGPDKKIYIAHFKPAPFSADTLSIIHEPGNRHPECNYEDNALITTNAIRAGLPNFVSTFLSDGITYDFGTNCDGDTTYFFPEDTLAVDSVRWNFGDPTSGSNSSTDLSAGHLFTSPDTFLVTLYSHRGGVTDTFTRNVIIWDRDLNLLGNDTTICDGQPITLNGEYNDACLLWSDNSTNNTYTTTNAGWHWLEVSYQSCVWRDSVFVTLVNDPPSFNLGNDTSVCGQIDFTIDPDLPGVYYTWQDGSHDTTYSVNSTGTYWLQASNACGSSSDTLNVILNTDAQPVLNFPEDTSVCTTTGLPINITFDGASYEWSDGFSGAVRTITQSGTYWVKISNSCDTVSDTMNVQIDQPVVSQLDDWEVHCGLNDTLKVVAIADSTPVSWSNGNTTGVLNVLQADTYSFEYSNACGLLRDTIAIASWDTNYQLRIGNDTTLCIPGASLIVGESREDYPWKFSWNTGPSTPLIEAGEGVYELTAQHRCASLTERVEIKVARQVGFADSAINRTICEGETKELSIISSEVKDIEWSDGSDGQSLTITEAGTYTVLITDTFGCEHLDSISFNEYCPGKVFASNVFTPNGDGQNDEFCVQVENTVSFTLSIFDRWGNEVYYSEDHTKCWDGAIHSTTAASGTYYYLLEIEDAQGEHFEFRGALSLLN